MTYNEISELLAERAGRQLDTPFNEEMKVLVDVWYSRLRRDTLEQNKRDRKFFKQYTEVGVEPINISTWPGFPDIRVVRTKCVIPTPLRANGILFDYVGSVDKLTSFGKIYSELHELRAALDGKYTGSQPKALWLNEYLWIFNALDLPAIGIDGIYDDIREANSFRCGCGCAECADDDVEYPGPRDLQQKIIQAILGTELKERGIPDTKTIEVDANSQTPEPHRN